MSYKRKIFSALAIFMLVALAAVPTVAAFEGRAGNRIVIEADEIVEDDLYIGAQTIIVDGIIKGDLYASAQTVIINGTITGDLVALAQNVTINGTVGDDIRVGAAAIQVAADAEVGDDLLFGGASLEMKSGSYIGGDLLIGAAQALVAGETEGDLLIGASAFELQGSVGGDLNAYVEAPENAMPMSYYGPSMNIPIPQVAPGITIDKKASVGGNLNYTSFNELTFPEGVVAGETLRLEPEYDEYHYEAPTPTELAGAWFLGLLRTIITLTLIGLLLGWLFPNLIPGAGFSLQNQPWQSLGWGMVTYVVYYFVLLAILSVMIISAMLFGVLSLGGLSASILVLGLLALFILIVGFILTLAYLTKIIVSVLGGNLLLARVKPEWVNHKVYPLLIGVVILSLIMSIPVAGWFFKAMVVFFGLGALWILGRDQFGNKEEGLEEA